MTPLRIGFDMDGVLADFAGAYHDVEVRLFGSEAPSQPGDPEKAESEESAPQREAAVAQEAGHRPPAAATTLSGRQSARRRTPG